MERKKVFIYGSKPMVLTGLTGVWDMGQMLAFMKTENTVSWQNMASLLRDVRKKEASSNVVFKLSGWTSSIESAMS